MNTSNSINREDSNFNISNFAEVLLALRVDNLKDQYFQPPLLESLAKRVAGVYPDFPVSSFLEAIQADPWHSLELMDRMRRVGDCFREYLPENYPQALGILRSASEGFSGFDSLVFPDFVQRYGLEHPDESISALEYFTELCSSEFAVRPFIERYPKRMFAQLKHWAKSKNLHHRRLASEGCRPRLPWASALKELKRDPSPILPILEMLKNDPELYVRRSVANNLNDISKDHPDMMVDRVRRWLGASAETDWIIKHACRSLLKQGRPDVLELFGFSAPGSISAAPLKFDRKRLTIGEELVFGSKLRTTKELLGKIRLEYAIHFVKKNGNTSPKVFQISEREDLNKEIQLSKKHSFKDLSTRKHYPGTHKIELRINGVVKATGVVEILK